MPLETAPSIIFSNLQTIVIPSQINFREVEMKSIGGAHKDGILYFQILPDVIVSQGGGGIAYLMGEVTMKNRTNPRAFSVRCLQDNTTSWLKPVKGRMKKIQCLILVKVFNKNPRQRLFESVYFRF